MYILVTIIHVIVSLFLIVVVLLQSGKAADLAGAFGGMGSQTVFGPRGSATVLTRATTISAIIFMCTSLSLAVLSTGGAATGSKPSLLDPISTPAGAPAAAPTSAAPAPAERPATLPVTVTPSVDGKEGAPQVINAPVLPKDTKPVQDGKQ
jgi:preprotein translocase subunit SecG